jgi:hypothetical protein
MLLKPKEMIVIDTQGSLVSLSRRIVLLSVLAPTGEILSFASPKESIQRKGDPDSANFLRFSLLCPVGIWRNRPARGAAWMPLVFAEPGMALRKPSPNTHRAQELRCSGRNNGRKTASA